MKKILVALILFIMIFIISISIFKGKSLNSDVRITVSRNPTGGMTEEHLKKIEVVKTIETMIVKKINEKGKQAFHKSGIKKEYNPSIVPKSWCLTIDGENFIIIEINLDDKVQSTVIMGIIDDSLITVTGYKEGSIPLPHTYGPVAEKVEEIFGIKFNKLKLNNKLSDSELKITVVREPAFGMIEEDFKDIKVVQAIEENIIEGMNEKIKKTFYNQEIIEKLKGNIVSKSRCLRINGKNFVIIKINLDNIIQSTMIMGIIDDAVITVSGYRVSSNSITYRYGPVADKVEEVFGIKFKKSKLNNK